MKTVIKNFLGRTQITHWIFVGLIGGFLIGLYVPALVPYIKPFRGLFLNGIKCIIAPLIFSSLVVGIGGTGSMRSLGITGFRAMVYFEIVTTAALFIGLGVVNWLQPGVGVHIGTVLPESLAHVSETHLNFGSFIEHLLPVNIAEAIVKGDVLQIVVFSTIFALALLAVKERAQPVLKVCEGLLEIMFRFTDMIMVLAPLGVASAMAVAVSEQGWQVFLPLMKLVGSLYVALAIFILIVLYPVALLFGIRVKAFVRQVFDPVALAFATTASEAAYPLALERLEQYGVPKRISSFVLPLGYSFNLDGSTLYLSMASVFVAQAAGVHLSLSQQLSMMLMLMITTKGVAAVPRASIVVLSSTLATFNLPMEGIALILAVDELMDMARTGTNLLGNCLATAVVARWEGVELKEE